MNYTLRSGRTVYACAGIFGPQETDQGFHVTHGYDDMVSYPAPKGYEEPDDPTADDMREIADLMIDRWTRFRASLPEVS